MFIEKSPQRYPVEIRLTALFTNLRACDESRDGQIAKIGRTRDRTHDTCVTHQQFSVPLYI